MQSLWMWRAKSAAAAAAAKSLQSCPTLCDPIDGSPPGFPFSGILQARTLEWVAISFSNAWKGKVKGKSLSRVQLLATPWTAAHQAPPSMGFSRQEYWSGVPLPSPWPYLGTYKDGISTCKISGWQCFHSLIIIEGEMPIFGKFLKILERGISGFESKHSLCHLASLFDL